MGRILRCPLWADPKRNQLMHLLRLRTIAVGRIPPILRSVDAEEG